MNKYNSSRDEGEILQEINRILCKEHGSITSSCAELDNSIMTGDRITLIRRIHRQTKVLVVLAKTLRELIEGEI